MLDITLLIGAVGACAVIFATEGARRRAPRFPRVRAVGTMIDRLAGLPVAAPMAAAVIVLLMNDRWWLLVTLNLACYGCTAPFMPKARLRMFSAVCGAGIIALTTLGLIR